MRFNVLTTAIVISSFLMGCGSGTTTTTTTTDDGSETTITELSTNFQNTAAGLVPEVSSGGGSDLSAFSVTYSDANFDALFSTYQPYIADIFGSEDEAPAVVTKIRVLLDSFANSISQLATADPDMDCSFTSTEMGAATTLNEGDTIDIAFLGSINNGSSSDRKFDCQFTDDQGDDGESIYLYGSDSAGNIYIVQQQEDLNGVNNEEAETRGTTKTIVQVIYGIYHQESGNGDTTIAQLDLQYAQASIYSGPDDTMSTTTDNVIFKSRSRITGTVSINEDSSITQSSGQFSVIKYDKGNNQDTSTYTAVNQFMGRGNFQAGGSFIFSMNSIDNGTPAFSSAPNFCVQQTESLELASSDESNCTTDETAFPWSSLNFDISPSLAANFEENALFTTEDLIANDASDFIVPTYE